MSIQYAGGTNVNTTFTGTAKNDILAAVFTNFVTAGMSVVSGITPSTVTMTIASPCVVSLTAHGLADGTRIVFSTTGALPTGITANTVYFVKSPLTNSFNVATTSGGTAINTSGSQSGVHTMNSEILFQTATTPQGFALRYRFRDNAGTCVQASIESTDGSKVGGNGANNGASLLPGLAKVWRLIANKYQFCMFVPGDYNVSREFVLGSCPYVFSFTPAIANIGFLVTNTINDTNTSNPFASNWRYSLTSGNAVLGNCQMLYNTSIWENANQTNWNNANGWPALLVPFGGNSFSTVASTTRYSNGDDITGDALVCWGLTTYSDESQIRGQLWDALIIADAFMGDTTTSFDTHNWIAVTSATTSSTKLVLFLVAP